jgi:PAS domain S-box-containing protein
LPRSPMPDRVRPPSPVADSLYRQIVQSAVDYAVVSCDLQGYVTTWNEGAQRVLGWTETEMRGQRVHRFFTPEDVAAGVPAAEMAAAQRDGKAADERWHLRKGGERFWASGELMPLRGDSGEVTGFIKILRDRTLERQEAARREKVQRDLKFLAEASAELASLSDYQTTLEKLAHLAVPHFADWCAVDMLTDGGSLQRVAVAHADPAKEQLARDIHRRFPDRVVAGGPWNVLRTGRAEWVEEITDEAMQRAIADPEYLAALRALGLRSYLGVPLAVRGKILGVIIFVTAESNRRYTAEDQSLAQDLARRAAVAIENANLVRALQESDRAKDVFLATLAHELRNPLAPVWNGLSIIKRVPHDTVRVQQVADMIERQVGQLARLVDDLLDVSRITTGKIELKKQRTDLASILHSAIETSRPHIEAAGHKLSVELPDEPIELEADPVRLAQVFSNLLNNAAKYTRPGGNIEVVVQAEPERLVVRVRDSGAGIPLEMLGKIFGLFTQVTHPAERTQGGLGIGLSLVEGLVRLHGGSVEARSEGLDKGSEFIVYLPRLRPPVPTAAPHGTAHDANRSAAARRRRILVVDDNQDAANTLAELLQMLGSEISVAHDGASAVERVVEFTPDVVLLDIGLPDIDGYEAARRIRGLEGVRQPRLIALTGWGQEQDKRLAEQAGFDDHWTKPVDPQRLQQLAG